MNEMKTNLDASYKKEITVKKVIGIAKEWIGILLKNWIVIVLFTVIGVISGWAYFKLKVPMYTAESTFILDDKQSGGSNNLSALTALGFGSNGGGEGLYGSDNIVWFYTSRLMIQRTLLTSVKKDNKDVILIEWFKRISGLNKKFSKDPRLSSVRFTRDDVNRDLSYDQNIIVGTCVDLIKEKYLKVAETKKTENIITVSVKSSDELFSKAFTDAIVNNVNSYYIRNKIKGISEEVAEIKARLDSVKYVLNSSMYQTAASTDLNPNANPMMQVLRVAPQRKSIDVQTNLALYVELVKNLEASKLALSQSTPIIQVIDAPILPLPVEKTSLIICMLIGSVGMALLSILYFIGQELIKRTLV